MATWFRGRPTSAGWYFRSLHQKREFPLEALRVRVVAAPGEDPVYEVEPRTEAGSWVSTEQGVYKDSLWYGPIEFPEPNAALIR